MRRSVATLTVFIDQPAQALKQIRQPVDFVQYDQPVAVLLKIVFRIGELGAILFRFQIEINCLAGLGDLLGQSCFADLSWAEDGDSRDVIELFVYRSLLKSGYHPCIIGIKVQFCKEKRILPPNVGDFAGLQASKAGRCLPQCFTGDHGAGDGDIQRPGAIDHGDCQAGIGGFVDGIGNAGRFAADQ